VRFEKGTGVEEKYKKWRSHSSLDQIIYLQGFFVVFGEMLQFFEILEPVIEHSGRYSGIPLVITSQNFIQHFWHAYP